MTYPCTHVPALSAVLAAHTENYDKYKQCSKPSQLNITSQDAFDQLLADREFPHSSVANHGTLRNEIICYRSSSSSSSSSDTDDTDELSVLREAQIRWLVAAYLHRAPSRPRSGLAKITADPFKYIGKLRLHGSQGNECLQKYTSLYVDWWDSAYYTSRIDIYEQLINDMDIHLTMAAKTIKCTQLDKFRRRAGRLINQHLRKRIYVRFEKKYEDEFGRVRQTIAYNEGKRMGILESDPSIHRNMDARNGSRASCPSCCTSEAEGEFDSIPEEQMDSEEYDSYPASVQTWTGAQGDVNSLVRW